VLENLGVVGNYSVSKLEALDVFAHSSHDTDSFVARDQWKFCNELAYTDVSQIYSREMATNISKLALVTGSRSGN
jgi:hypothetical protein